MCGPGRDTATGSASFRRARDTRKEAKDMNGHRVDFNMLAWEIPMEGIRSKTVEHGGRKLRLVEYTPAMKTHWCERGHIGCVLEGRLETRFDNETVVYEAGDGVFIPSGRNHRHMGRALTDVVRVVFVEDV
jgi:mannose-6-phosphate isomerase-like protein (cupin superfamily)